MLCKIVRSQRGVGGSAYLGTTTLAVKSDFKVRPTYRNSSAVYNFFVSLVAGEAIR